MAQPNDASGSNSESHKYTFNPLTKEFAIALLCLDRILRRVVSGGPPHVTYYELRNFFLPQTIHDFIDKAVAKDVMREIYPNHPKYVNVWEFTLKGISGAITDLEHLAIELEFYKDETGESWESMELLVRAEFEKAVRIGEIMGASYACARKDSDTSNA